MESVATSRRDKMTLSGASLWQQVLSRLPLIAILRGVEPHEAVEMAEALSLAGFLCVEVPLNSPNALESISRLRRRFEGRLLIGAGTVLTEPEVAAIHQAGAQIAVSPNTNPGVIAVAKGLGLISVPGFATPTEALAGIAAGADALKLFPAESAPARVVRALKAVLPTSPPIFPVGGITTANMAAYVAAGAGGFGIGSALYTPGASADIVGHRAALFVKAWTDCATSE
jgi:2-dehydro-3-deoxyphosphogalactonate aldolase